MPKIFRQAGETRSHAEEKMKEINAAYSKLKRQG
jgi:hypothetical protein